MNLPKSSSSSSLRWIENFKGTTDFYREPIPFFPTMIIKISERDSSIDQIFETSLQLEKPGKLSYKDIQHVVANGIMSSSSSSSSTSTANASATATATPSLNDEWNIIGAATFIVSLEPDEVPFYLRSKTEEEDAAFHETFFQEIDVDALASGSGSTETSHNVHLERSINIFHDTNMLFIIIQKKKKKKLCEIEKKKTRKRIFDSVKQMFFIRGGGGSGSGSGRNEDSTKLSSRKGRETRKSRKG